MSGSPSLFLGLSVGSRPDIRSVYPQMSVTCAYHYQHEPFSKSQRKFKMTPMREDEGAAQDYAHHEQCEHEEFNHLYSHALIPSYERPYSFHLRATNSFVASSICSSVGHFLTLPSAGNLAVASKPILLPAPRSGDAWSRMSTGPCTTSVSRAGSQLAKRWKRTSCSSWTLTWSSTTTMNLVKAIWPAPRMACMTLLAW